MINNPSGIRQEVNVPRLLKDLGFVTTFKGARGYLKLDHPDLLLEFLVPEKGKGTDKPVHLPKLGMNAVALRFLSYFLMHPGLLEGLGTPAKRKAGCPASCRETGFTPVLEDAAPTLRFHRPN